MSGLFGVLDLASRAMLVTQNGIRTTGHNIANVETPGYSRQRQVLQAARPLETGHGALGMGVEQGSVQRVTDDLVERELVSHNSSSGSTDVQAEALSRIEEVFNEQQGQGLTAALSKLYDAFQDLATAQTPRQPAEREAVRSSARTLIDVIHGADTQLREQQAASDRSIVGMLPGINASLERIQELNAEIVRAEVLAPANDLRDARDQLVRDLAGQIDVTTFEQANGAIVITLSNGLPLVEGQSARRLEAQPDATNPFSPTFSRIYYSDGVSRSDVTDEIGGGRLGGLLRARDTLVPAAVRSLDTVAYNLATTVNAVHTTGQGLDGVSGGFFAAPAAVEDAAKLLALDARVATSSEAIAAGLGNGTSDNRNALALAALRDTAAPLALPGDPPGPPTGPTRSVLDHAASIVADIGHEARSLGFAREQAARVLGVLESRRDAVSGVSMDEEVTTLMKLQASFQANVRVVTVIDRLLQDVVQMI